MPRNGKKGNGRKQHTDETKELARARVAAGESLSGLPGAGHSEEHAAHMADAGGQGRAPGKQGKAQGAVYR